MPKQFQKKVEYFGCDNCGLKVKGTGYTNHCPNCLWSKHVDVNPGDRSEPCLGLMKPIAVEIIKSEYILIHRCEACGKTKKNKSAKDDNFEEILKLT